MDQHETQTLEALLRRLLQHREAARGAARKIRRGRAHRRGPARKSSNILATLGIAVREPADLFACNDDPERGGGERLLGARGCGSLHRERRCMARVRDRPPPKWTGPKRRYRQYRPPPQAPTEARRHDRLRREIRRRRAPHGGRRALRAVQPTPTCCRFGSNDSGPSVLDTGGDGFGLPVRYGTVSYGAPSGWTIRQLVLVAQARMALEHARMPEGGALAVLEALGRRSGRCKWASRSAAGVEFCPDGQPSPYRLDGGARAATCHLALCPDPESREEGVTPEQTPHRDRRGAAGLGRAGAVLCAGSGPAGMPCARRWPPRSAACGSRAGVRNV